MPTLLQVLTRPNISVDTSLVPAGGNTTINTTIHPLNWRPWRGFDYTTLAKIFRKDLERDYRGSAMHEPLPQDLRIVNEETLDDLLRRFEIPTVNYCLSGRSGDSHFGRGSRCMAYYKPDWSVLSSLCLDENGCYANILPGDTKLGKKWWPAMKREGGTRFAEWKKVIAQIVTYMAYNNSRYGFIITDEYLVALRLTRKVASEALVTERTPRVTVSHVNYPSDASMEDTSEYQDTDPVHWRFEDPEYITVPWKAHGSRLTPKLTLWFLAMMAANGYRFLDFSYPDLDSWRRCNEGGYVHNTSGARKSKLSRGEQVQEPGQGQVPQNWDGTGEHGEWDRDEPSFSQRSDDLGGDQLGNYGDEEEEEEEEEEGVEASGGDDDDDDDEAEDDEDGEEEEGGDSSHPQKKSIEVKIQKSKFGKGLYFLDAKKHKKKTTKKEWSKIEGGYMLPGKKHVYFAKKFP